MPRLFKSALTALTVSVALVALKTAALSQATNVIKYQCDEDKAFTAEYLQNSQNSVRATFGSKVITLPQVESASGTRYSDGSVTLSTKGYEAFVQVGDDILFKNCSTTQRTAAQAAAKQQNVNQETTNQRTRVQALW